jgi:L,D-peptidoglycan transpeptidase YkuD (ErfK/YbiS/YcfS/YnhG family)
LAAAAFILLVQKPPLELIDKSRESLAKAREAEAQLYSPAIFARADNLWKELLGLWTKENGRLGFRRDFGNVGKIAAEIDSLAKIAISETDSLRKSVTAVARIRLMSTDDAIKQFRVRYGHLPIPKKVRKKALRAEMILNEAASANARGEYKTAYSKIITAEKDIGEAETKANTFLQDYYSRLPMWKKWAAAAVASSKKKGASILVDKMDKKCLLYVNGKVKAEFHAELGQNWMMDKKQKGDLATPEGEYFVTRKKGKGDSKYYKALLINYPNEADKKFFKSSGGKGSIKQLGGLIEIHGHGDKGADWTEGCVAIKNSEMDILFKYANVGTPVTIVGALENPPDWLLSGR